MSMNKDKGGVSVVICCYNSVSRLEKTLRALSIQKFDFDLFWEILVIDNASSDDTAGFARQTWTKLNTSGAVSFDVLYEAKPGLIHARKKGIKEARYSYILFCDDDNWLCDRYVQGVFDILSKNDSVAACGGKGIPFFEGEKPDWFDTFSEAYAVGSQIRGSEDCGPFSLYGAGLAINYQALHFLESRGFSPMLVGRTGKQLSSAEDTELTNAFVLAGFRLVADDKLTFYHFLGNDRLSFKYLIRLFKAFGTDGPVRNLYFSFLRPVVPYRFLRNWYFHFMFAHLRLVKYYLFPPKKFGRKVYLEWSRAYILQLIRLKSGYTLMTDSIRKVCISGLGDTGGPLANLNESLV